MTPGSKESEIFFPRALNNVWNIISRRGGMWLINTCPLSLSMCAPPLSLYVWPWNESREDRKGIEFR